MVGTADWHRSKVPACFSGSDQSDLEAFRASRLRERDEAVKLHAAYIKDRLEHPEIFPGRKR